MPDHQLYEATLFIGWAVLAMYWWWDCGRACGFWGCLFRLCCSCWGVCVDAESGPACPQSRFDHAWSSLHASFILLSYGAFGLGGVAGLMFLTQEHNLKYNKLRAVTGLWPSLQRLELAASGLLVAGLVLLTVDYGPGHLAEA